PFHIPDSLDHAMDDRHEGSRHLAFSMSSTRDEPFRSSTGIQIDTEIAKPSHVSEADRLSRARFDAIFADIDAEVALSRANKARLTPYSHCEPVARYPLETGISIEDTKRVLNAHTSPI